MVIGELLVDGLIWFVEEGKSPTTASGTRTGPPQNAFQFVGLDKKSDLTIKTFHFGF
jgi:hypothetical protein